MEKYVFMDLYKHCTALALGKGDLKRRASFQGVAHRHEV